MPRVQVGKGRSIAWFVAVGDSIESAPGYRNDFHAAAAIQNDEWLHRIAADTAPIVPVGALLLAAIILLQTFPFTVSAVGQVFFQSGGQDPVATPAPGGGRVRPAAVAAGHRCVLCRGA